jgi:hypothetical protein
MIRGFWRRIFLQRRPRADRRAPDSVKRHILCSAIAPPCAPDSAKRHILCTSRLLALRISARVGAHCVTHCAVASHRCADALLRPSVCFADRQRAARCHAFGRHSHFYDDHSGHRHARPDQPAGGAIPRGEQAARCNTRCAPGVSSLCFFLPRLCSFFRALRRQKFFHSLTMAECS